MKKIIFISTLILSQLSLAGLLYPYDRLVTKNLDQMSKLIKDKIKESRSVGGDKTIPLKEAVQAVFSRPNDDFLIEKILPPLRSELDEHNAWEKAILALVQEATGALNNPKKFKRQALATYAIFLRNLILEMKPKLADSFENKVITQIRDAKIELNKETEKELRLTIMKDTQSPSTIAQAVLTEASQPKPETVPSK